jgi:chromosome segregation ATPase
MMANISAAVTTQASQKARQEQTRAAAGVLTRGDAFNAQGQYDDALPLYLQILTSYPLSTQTDAAMKGIETSVKGLIDKAEQAKARTDQITAQNDQITALQNDLRARMGDVSRVKKFIYGMIGVSGDPEAANLDAVLQALQAKYSSLSNTAVSGDKKLQDDLDTAQRQNNQLISQIDSLKSELEAVKKQAASIPLSQNESRQLKDLQNRLAALDKSYTSYAALEDPVLARRGLNALVDTKAYLDSFLGSKPVDDMFPGILARIKLYDQGFEAAGRAGALQDVVDMVVALSQARTPEQKKAYIDQQLKTYQSDGDMTDFLSKIQGLVK